MSSHYRYWGQSLLRGSLGAMLLCCAAVAGAQSSSQQAGTAELLGQSFDFDVPAQKVSTAILDIAKQAQIQALMAGNVLDAYQAEGLNERLSLAEALDRVLSGTPYAYQQTGRNAIMVGTPEALQEQSAVAGQNQVGQRQPGIEEIIVTGQKREERIQDVPIAISAFSAEDLDAQKLEGGFDLVKAIPNVSFTKTNFTSYNFQIRGVGTQSISATSDPGVAVAFNNAAIIQNRLFEQEYLDVERVEVLRGPQGTLYGRNATAGVINVISNKPEMGVWDGMLDVEVGNYNTRRLRGHFNMPIGDTFAIRGAYASTDREGYTFNSGTDNRVDGRDLWSGRLSLAWQPNDRFRADLIWERFEEEDDRLRTGKQLCHRNDVTVIGDTTLDDPSLGAGGGVGQSPEDRIALLQSTFSQGCEPGSLYTDGAFDTPNGLSLNYINPILMLSKSGIDNISTAIGVDPDCDGSVLSCGVSVFQQRDPYGGRRQSRDLREIESIRDPVYRASADLFDLTVNFDVTDTLTLTSQTVYVEDETYSFQDFNRFNTDPIFTDTSQIGPTQGNDYSQLAPEGEFCDPQFGCSDKLAGFDIAQGSAEQFNQEFRLQSAFAGPVNFSLGANYTKFETVIDYYVFINALTALAATKPLNDPGGPFSLGSGSSVYGDPNGPPTMCATSNFWNNFPAAPSPFPAGYPIPPTNSPAVPTSHPDSPCPYIDPNPIDTSRNFGTGGNNEGEGHNYFRSKNPYELESWAGFGEIYWNIQEDLKLTAGLRYTDDTKTFTVVPSQLLTAPGYIAGGTTPIGYPTTGVIEQNWGEWTGRLVLDWQPVLNFTDETLLYASFSRGYKGGGANPPTPGFATKEENEQILLDQGYGQGHIDYYGNGGFDSDGDGVIDVVGYDDLYPVLELTADEYGETFEPEFVNAFEIGTKNTLFGGAVMLNMTAFYYDYTDYQVSQIRDRTAVNENFDSEMWGLELETVFSPTPNWQFLANVGYLDTKIAEGETSIDIMNRTQGNPDYALVKPWVQLPSNCVVPTHVAESWLNGGSGAASFVMCGVGGVLGQIAGASPIIDPEFGDGTQPYDHTNYPELNGGAGLRDDLGGNELPQSPNLTVTLGGQYSFDLTRDWRATTRIDYYWQDESYHRIYNTEPYDRLKSWSNTNLSFWVNNANTGITVEAYVKNLFNETPITGAFLNSDDTGLTTNVFMFDPRLIGVSVRKEW